jgi:hypothetical protein
MQKVVCRRPQQTLEPYLRQAVQDLSVQQQAPEDTSVKHLRSPIDSSPHPPPGERRRRQRGCGGGRGRGSGGKECGGQESRD